MKIKIGLFVILFVVTAIGSYLVVRTLQAPTPARVMLCGNQICDAGEETSCPADCEVGASPPAPVTSMPPSGVPPPKTGPVARASCGDNVCTESEKAAKSCPQDCGGAAAPGGGGGKEPPTVTPPSITPPPAQPSPAPPVTTPPPVTPPPVAPPPITPPPSAPLTVPATQPTSCAPGSSANSNCLGVLATLPASLPWTDSEILVGDVNGNGSREILMVRLVGGSRMVEAWEYTGTSFNRLFSLPFGAYGLAAAGDLDNDGKTELIAGDRSGSTINYKCYSVSGNLGSLIEDCSITLKETSSLASIRPFGRIHDIDGDGTRELVLAGIPTSSQGTSGATVFSLASQGNLSQEYNYLITNGNVGSFNIIDANGNGKPEVILPISQDAGNGTVNIFEATGINSYQSIATLPFPNPEVYQVVVGSFTAASEKQFIVIGKSPGNSYTIRVFDYVSGSYQIIAETGLSGRAVPVGALLAAGDLNGDNRDEAPNLVLVEEDCCPGQDHMPTYRIDPGSIDKIWDFHSLTTLSAGPHLMFDIDGDGIDELIQKRTPLSGGVGEVVILTRP